MSPVHSYTTYHARCENVKWNIGPGRTKVGLCQWIGDTSYETRAEALAALKAHEQICEYKS